MDLPHSRPHKVFRTAPTKPFSKFLAAVDRVVTNCIHSGGAALGPPCKTMLGDARSIALPAGSIDLVLTSPPYLNAIDYLRCSKFSLVWMGHTTAELQQLRGRSVGSEVGRPDLRDGGQVHELMHKLGLLRDLPLRQQAILARYIHDMDLAMNQAARVLAPGGKAIYVIGENTIRGTYIPNSQIVTTLARALGLKLRARRQRKLPENRRYLPPPASASGTQSLNGRMRREVILCFEKQ